MSRPKPRPALPDYTGGGFVNLIASLVESRGGAPRHAPLAMLQPAELHKAQNVVLVIVDGLGDRYLAAQGPNGALARHRRGDMSAVFPSTTASAITTSFTGATPLEHGLTGWFTYFSAAGCVGAPLPFVRRGDRSPLAGSPAGFFSESAYFPRLKTRSILVTWRPIVGSLYNSHHNIGTERHAYEDLAGFVELTAAAVRSGQERKFIYAYWWQLDALAHQHGVDSTEVAAHFAALDAAFSELLARIAGSDTLVVLTADHGFLDCPEAQSIELPPQLAAQLRFPLCGERRVAFCHAQDATRFARDAAEFFGERADVRPSRELADEGWFGIGREHPDFAERIGDVALVMRGRATVKDWVVGEARHLHIGNHGGTSEDEMRIPLIVAAA